MWVEIVIFLLVLLKIVILILVLSFMIVLERFGWLIKSCFVVFVIDLYLVILIVYFNCCNVMNVYF